mgnify:CR=1 FL=1
MRRFSAAEYNVPVSAISVDRLSLQGDPLFGLLLSARANNPPHLIDRTAHGTTVIALGGPRGFQRINLRQPAIIEGLWFPQISFAVDITSRIDPQIDGKVGDLSMSYGKLNLLSWDGQTDPPFPEPFPTPFDVDTGDDSSGVGFRKWSIYARVENVDVELWRWPEPISE